MTICFACFRQGLPRLLAPVREGGEGGGASVVDDHELVARFQKGDEKAFQELVIRHRGRVFGLVRGMVRNEADAWDLTQDIFLKVWKALPRFEANAQFSTWLYRVAHNAVYDWLRKRKIRPEHELEEEFVRPSGIAAGATTAPDEALRPDQAAEQQDLRVKLQVALDALSEKHRAVIVLKDIQGLKYREIAEVVGCSLGTVMSRIHHARQQLQGLLADER